VFVEPKIIDMTFRAGVPTTIGECKTGTVTKLGDNTISVTFRLSFH